MNLEEEPVERSTTHGISTLHALRRVIVPLDSMH